MADRSWALDAGGSNTTALLDDGARLRAGSVNPASVGAAAADAELLGLLRRIADALAGAPAAGWIASATVGPDTCVSEVDRLGKLAATAGLTGPLTVSRDVLPLLLARPLSGRGVAVVCGTGSGFVAGSGDAPPVSVGGCEYLGSDEGSAYAIGLAGLRAAVRGVDGRAPANGLAAAFGADPRELARALAREPYPKAAVAALAPAVCTAWLDGDAAAGAVVDGALADLAADAAHAARLAGLEKWSAVLAGGVFLGCPPFAAALADRLTHAGAERAAVAEDPAAMVLSALRESPGGVLPHLTGWAWAA